MISDTNYGHPFHTLYAAKVKDNDDTLKQGRVQIKIDTFMWGWSQSLLPWARPFFNNVGSNTPTTTYGESNIPEKGTTVWVWFEDDEHKKNPFYITGLQLQDINPHKLFDLSIKPMLLMSTVPLSTMYPDTKFKILKNMMATFWSSGTTSKEMGIYHDPASYIIIDNGGNLNINVPMTTFWGPGPVIIQTGPLMAAGVTAPATLTLTGSNVSHPPEPAVLSTELTVLLTSLTSAISALSAAASSLATAAGTVPVPNPIAVAAANASIGAASTFLSTAIGQIPSILSQNVVSN